MPKRRVNTTRKVEKAQGISQTVNLNRGIEGSKGKIGCCKSKSKTLCCKNTNLLQGLEEETNIFIVNTQSFPHSL